MEVESQVTVVEDFEDGNIEGWSGDTGNFSAQQNTVLSGNYSGRLAGDDATTFFTVDKDFDLEQNKITFDLKISDELGFGEEFDVSLNSSLEIVNLGFNEDNNIVNKDDPLNPEVIGSWSAGTTYNFEIVLDFANNQFDLVQDGSIIATDLNFFNEASSVDTIQLTSDGVGNSNLYIDDITTGGTLFELTGSEQAEISVSATLDAEKFRTASQNVGVGVQAEVQKVFPVTGVVDFKGAPVEGAEVYAIREGDQNFVGYDATNSSGEYEIFAPIQDGDTILVAADYFDGQNYFEDERSIIYNE